MQRWNKATKRSRSTSNPSTPRLRSGQAPLGATLSTSKSGKKGPATKALPPPTPSEAAFEAALRALDGHDDTVAFIDRVFAHADQYLTDPYATIGDALHFHTKIAGVSFEGRQDIIAGLHAGAPLQLLRQPANPHDRNAIAVHYGELQLGFFNKRLAAHIAPRMDTGARYSARVASLTGGAEKNRGVNIFVERDGAALGRRKKTSTATPGADRSEMAERVRSALIGDAVPHEAQRAVLERIDAGKNTLAVMGTGRGKSFCFQFSAAIRSFCDKRKTLVIYPLRALANDQYEAVRRTLEPLGLRCFRANGSIDNDERDELFAALATGAWDIVLATPEFLEFHRSALGGESAPSLAVVDEAHHVHESRHRPAYARLAATLAALGDPQVLALTATAADDAFRRIADELRINAWVIDPTVRENLGVVDARGTRDKHRYLIELLRPSTPPKTGSDRDRGKCIVYCNSRGEVTTVAKRLRKELGDEVMFYHAKMPNSERLEVERLFRDGALRVVIATAAFGEGIDLPDVADVVLYHLNFDFGEFNQQAGRAGRDGRPSNVHLLYGATDRALNDYLIDLDAPPIGLLREIYRGLKSLARAGIIRGGDTEIAGLLDGDRIRDRHVTAALRIFADSNLIELDEDDEGRFVRLLTVTGRIEMEQNERYAEGEATREAFARFAEMALNAPASTLERIINRPIYPSTVPLRR